MKKLMLAMVVSVLFVGIVGAYADISYELVTVGDVGNAADDTGYGAVGYVYLMGKYMVTNAQYTEFLNKVAVTDPNGLYNANMADGAKMGGIVQVGAPGSYAYHVRTPADTGGYPADGSPYADYGQFNVSFVSMDDGRRFANWMNNGQPTGAQDASTTEDGAYDMSLGTGVRKAGATYFMPSEDEWYKAAYYKGGGTNAGYFDYATSSDVHPAESKPSADPNLACYGRAAWPWDPELVAVGSYTGSASPYGTFDQNGLAWERTEAVDPGTGKQIMRGGDYYGDPLPDSGYRDIYPGSIETGIVGLRIGAIPEPATLALLGTGGLMLIRRGKRR